MTDIQKHLTKVEAIDVEINKLQATIADQLNSLKEKRIAANALLEDAIIKEADEQLSDKDYGCGTANIETEFAKIKVVVRKGVKWDEFKLREVANSIKAAGQDPEAYIKYKMSVSETAYKNFEPEIQNVFKEARTVQPSKPSISYERKV